MQNSSNLPQGFSMEDAMRLAGSPAGQKLLAILQRNDGGQLQSAMDQATAGNYDQAKKALSSLLADPETKKLLEQLGR